MKKLLTFTVVAIISFYAFAQHRKVPLTLNLQKFIPLNGTTMWVIDMDKSGKIEPNSIFNGKDTILVDVYRNEPKNVNNTLSYHVNSDPRVINYDIIKYDSDNDGIVGRDDLNKSTLALMKFNKDGEVSLLPISNSKIDHIKFIKHIDPNGGRPSIDKMVLVSDKGDEFDAIVYKAE